MEKPELARLNRELITQGIEVYEIALAKSDLERIFIDMVTE